ncbi:MAG: hypothetical protein ACRYE8_01280 [Janthinobacterium lividum]
MHRSKKILDFIVWGHYCVDHSPPCHPMIYSWDPVKNTNKISIFYYFLDLVPKQLDDYLRAFFDPRGQCRHGMTPNVLSDVCGQL